MLKNRQLAACAALVIFFAGAAIFQIMRSIEELEAMANRPPLVLTKTERVEVIKEVPVACNTGFQAYYEQRTRYYATKYGVEPNFMVSVVRCESGFRPWAVGKAGEIGLPQFMRGTFYGFAKQYGLEGYDIQNPEHALDLMARMFADGYSYHWTCAKTQRPYEWVEALQPLQ